VRQVESAVLANADMLKWVVVDKPKEFRPRFVVRLREHTYRAR
jgi:hypothetical protein